MYGCTYKEFVLVSQLSVHKENNNNTQIIKNKMWIIHTHTRTTKKYNCMYRCAIEQKLNKKIRCKDVGWWWIYKVIAHLYCTVGEHVTVYEVDYLGKETVLMPDCPGIRCSVAPTRWQKFKKEMAWMWEIQSDFLSPFSHSGCIQFLEGAPIILSGARTVLCILLISDFVSEPNQTVIEVHRLHDGRVELCEQQCSFWQAFLI